MTLTTRPAMTDDSGLFTDGTVVNKALVDSVFDQIDDQNHSTTNTTIKPKAIIDEVVTARGSKATLDARLDVSLEEDGTLKSSAQPVTAAQLKSIVGSINVVKNGDLDDWSSGASAAPDDFTLSVITVARTATSLNAGQYMARLTRAGADGFLYQDIIAAADFSNYSLIAELGLKFSFTARVKSSVANQCRITVDDGSTTSSSSYHTGGGADETLTVTHTIAGAATRLRIRVDLNNSNGDADVGGFIAAFSDVAITSWKPLTVPPLATATRRGLIGTAADQQLPGRPVFQKQPSTKLEATSDQVRIGGVHASFSDFTDYAITNAAIQDSGWTKTFQAAALQVGNVLRVTVFGISSGGQNVARQVAVSFGGTSVFVVNQRTANAVSGNWQGVAYIAITGAATERLSGNGYHTDSVNDISNLPDYQTAAVAISGAIILKTRLNSSSGAETMTQKGVIVEIL